MRDDANSAPDDTHTNYDEAEAQAIECEASVEAIEREEERKSPDYIEKGSPIRQEVKDKIKLAYISGKANLAYMSRTERVPYATLMRWSMEESWAEKKQAVAQRTESETIENIADFVAKERVMQIKRAISRAGKLRSLVDKAAENAERSEEGLKPSDVQALSTAEERADNITRRNLGMDQQSGGGNSLSVNILSQSIVLS